MHVVMVSKACIVGAYQRKLEELAKLPEMRLTVLTPPAWRDSRGLQTMERVYTQGYDLRVTPLVLNGHFHLHYYPRLRSELEALRPDLLHVDEEPYNFAAYHAYTQAGRLRIPAIFFTWQNLLRRYPPPFRWWEQRIFRQSAHAIAGSLTASHILRAKGYTGPISVIPQFGVDPDLFCPASTPPPPRPFTVGYAGGLLPEKGIDSLLHACAQLDDSWQLHIAGSGREHTVLQALAQRLGIADRVIWQSRLPSTTMPDFYRQLDAFVLPSRTRRNWMEQFGRVLIEAMACATPVIGSNSGEIPHVIADAGLIFPEGDAAALAAHLRRLQHDPTLRGQLGHRGRARVLACYTHAHIAAAAYRVYGVSSRETGNQ